MWPRQSTFNRNTTYSDYSRNPFTDTRPRLPLTASSLGILPEAEAAESVNWTTFPPGGSNPTAVRENHNRTEEYVPVRSNWRRASTSEDVRLQSTRDTAFYNFYEDLLPNGTRDSVAQNMRRRPSYF
ncbi:hypothetical protein KVT40_008947 [Elsinoe batatas]|uniref:Uncharacterized protein n=1 Tax=Elsinoe batatas TaxID=2601811 RepID=A0A8K0PBZ5_9PEZI|nr:hypothetical protein KVT40_008947 [Elsinoe batatas]